MFNKLRLIAFSTVLCLILLISSFSCGDKTPGTTDSDIEKPGSITIEKTVTAANTLVSTLGDTITITDNNSPLSGMEVVVPQESYEYSKNFIISYAPVKKHTFGEDFNPATPLITIENGGDYSDELMQVTIPIEVPSGYFAMGFYYDSAAGKLEGMATLAQGANSITVGTRHFSSFLISTIKLTKLKLDIDSGFRPGIDDWQFVNNGSYIASGGHCAGQSMTAAWYYVTQPDGKDLALYNRYDNNGKTPATPTIWQDDSYGYRFASTVQKDIDWGGFAFKFWRAQRGVSDELTWNLFCYSMQLTGEPQMVGLTKEGKGGHAVICYRIKDGKLYIADPNYPGNLERRVEYETNKLKTYESGANKADIDAGNSIGFDKIGYTGKSSIIEWDKISERWAEFKAGTIGNDRFPAYKIIYKNEEGNYVELKDGHIATSNLIDLNSDTAFDGSITVFRDGKALLFDSNGNITLNPGNNLLGIYIRGVINGSKSYIDFKYINVIYGNMTINPASQEMGPNVTRTFSLELSEAAPQGSSFEWYVDGVLKQTGQDFSISVSFPAEGEHIIICKMVDNTGKVLQQAQSKAIVKAQTTTTFTYNNLTALQTMTKLRLSLGGKWEITKWSSYERETVYDSWLNQTIPYYNPGNPEMLITWAGTSFSGENITSNSIITRTEVVTGTVSSDGTTLLSLNYTMTYVSDDLKSNGLWHKEEEINISLVNIPIAQLAFNPNTSSTFNFSIYGPNMSNYLDEVIWHSITKHDSVTDVEYWAYGSTIDWSGEGLQGTPAIILIMS